MNRKSNYIPALRYDLLTPFYDWSMRLLMPEVAFKRHLVQQAGVSPGMRILDLGCGTATLTILIKQAHSQAVVVGLDGDPRTLAIGREKVQKAGLEIQLDEGMAFALPYPDRSFDRVLTSLVIHHLTTEDKYRTMKEVLRVLNAGGEFHIADFGPPGNTWARFIGWWIKHFEAVDDNYAGLLPGMLREAGFGEVEATGSFNTIFGTLVLLRTGKPD